MQYATLIELLQWRALEHPQRPAYTFLKDGEEQEVTLTYAKLNAIARHTGAWLERSGATGKGVLLIYPPGLEYITAFLGCLYAGAVAIPVYPPRANRNLNRLKAIIADAMPEFALTDSTTLAKTKSLFSDMSGGIQLTWLPTDEIPHGVSDGWVPPDLSTEDLAFIQYTSGSTSMPKGVMVSHHNILCNEELIHRAFRQTQDSVILSWLPIYHDMGLIGSLLQPLYSGARSIFMSPAAFLQRPYRWLQAISRYQVTTSGGPNFAYELCIRNVTPEQRRQLDLSSWKVAFNGSEMVRIDTLEKFAVTFHDCGFRREALCACYGLAEATLFVSGGLEGGGAKVQIIDSSAMEQGRVVVLPINHEANGRVRRVVDCGIPPPEHDILIVNPNTDTKCSTDEIGEIWVSGPSVTLGYWNRNQETQQTFFAYLSNSSEKKYLRTGDLGFQQDGHLYIVGRLKDLIIIRGQNYFPEDIEVTIEKCTSPFFNGTSVAFSIDCDREEQLVVVQEVDRHSRIDWSQLIERLRRTIAEEHGLLPRMIVFVKRGSIPRTTSGKVQRQLCKTEFLQSNLPILQKWESERNVDSRSLLLNAGIGFEELEDIESWLISCLAVSMEINSDQIDCGRPLTEYASDSIILLEFAHAIESKYGVNLSVADLFDNLNIAALADKISIKLSNKNAVGAYASLDKENFTEYHLSYGQQSLWFLNQLAPNGSAYNLSFAARIKSTIHIDYLRRSLQYLVDRHISLQSTFRMDQGSLIQQAVQGTRVSFQVIDASGWTADNINKCLFEEAHRPFNLERGPVLRATLIEVAAHDYYFVLSLHHIVADLWSFAILIDELGLIYSKKLAKEPVVLPALKYNYSEFVEWQQEMLQGTQGGGHWLYWQNQLANHIPILDLPTDRVSSSMLTQQGATQTFDLDISLSRKVFALCQSHQVSLYTTLLSAFEALLYRYSGQNMFLIGSPMGGRGRAAFSDIVGYFVNTVVMKADLSNDPSFHDLLIRQKQIVIDALKHQDYPFSLLVDRLQPARETGHSSLFQVMFAFHRAPKSEAESLVSFLLRPEGAKLESGPLRFESVVIPQPTTQFALSLHMAEVDSRLVGMMQYAVDLFDSANIGRIITHFLRLVESIVDCPQKKLSSISLLSQTERQQILDEWNNTTSEYPEDKYVHELFEQQVEKNPDAVALVFEDQQLSYRELNRRANQLAHYLHSIGVGPDQKVAICLDRSLEIIVSLLAVLKAGGAYVPLDPYYPSERLVYMLEDSAATILLTYEALQVPPLGLFPTFSRINLDSDGLKWAERNEGNPDRAITGLSATNLAYLIYTSGSTGKPKGVMVNQQGLSNLAFAQKHSFNINSNSRVLQFASFSFDASVFEITMALCSGAALVISPRGLMTLGERLLETITSNRVTHATLPPAVLSELTDNVKLCSILELVVAGDVVTKDLAQRWSSCRRMINAYGPTEATVWASMHECGVDESRVPPIGYSIANTQLYILDKSYHLTPIGVCGEIYIGGAGVSQGYLNRPALTVERFIPDSFSQHPGKRVYRTGDLGRWLSNGEIEFLGRNDHQVKIRGNRIELGEIETRLSKYEDVETVVVIAHEDSDGMRLIAYYTVYTGTKIEALQLRSHLATTLPEYMLPAAYVHLETMPLTPNGKLDRRALPEPDDEAYAKRGYEEAQGEVEMLLAGMWSELLGVKRIGRWDNFFEMGGNSLLSFKLISRVRKSFQIEISLQSVFTAQTIAELSQIISQCKTMSHQPKRPSIKRINRDLYAKVVSDSEE